MRREAHVMGRLPAVVDSGEEARGQMGCEMIHTTPKHYGWKMIWKLNSMRTTEMENMIQEEVQTVYTEEKSEGIRRQGGSWRVINTENDLIRLNTEKVRIILKMID